MMFVLRFACRVAAPILAAVSTAGAEATVAEGHLLIRSDAAATLVVDGTPSGELAAGEVRLLRLAAGPRALVLVSRGGEATWAETVTLRAGQVVRLVRLAQMVKAVRAEYVRVPAGELDLGCVPGDRACADDEKPSRRVRIDRDFWLMRTEVTVRAYEGFAASSSRALPEPPRFNPQWKWKTYPIVNATWHDADAYCGSVGGRLPTEVEWEHGARAGQAGRRYVWGDAVRPVVGVFQQANVADERAKDAFEVQEGPWFDGYDDGYSRTAPTFQYVANGFGLFDMSGNVWEWCADRYDPASDLRVARGGSFMTGVAGQRVSNRQPWAPEFAAPDVGFRCAREVAVP